MKARKDFENFEDFDGALVPRVAFACFFQLVPLLFFFFLVFAFFLYIYFYIYSNNEGHVGIGMCCGGDHQLDLELVWDLILRS